MVASLLPRRRSFSRLALKALFLLILFTLPCGGAFWYLSRPTGMEKPHQIRIEPGTSARRIGQLLETRGLIHSAEVFALTVRFMRVSHRLEAGTYQLSGTKTTAGIVGDLLKAPVRTRRVTIPEGLTRREVAGLLGGHGLIDSARFFSLTEDAEFIRRLGIDAPTLEGYLFPETYFFDEETDAEEVIGRMVGEFHSVFTDSLLRRLKVIGLSLHQAVTLASIVEGEAMVQEERPIISGVFQRRLKLNRRLESCATVEYALGVHKKRLTNADLQVDSPYNTYRHRHLPPGPIGNPGKAALLATLYPTPTDFLYFVARGDGTHIFSRTNKEHVQAKKEIRRQLRRSRSAR
jgi:UPF0755 protein